MDKINYIIVHHTGAEEKDAGQVRRYHLSLGWRDVGYHYLIERDGEVVLGRPFNMDGAHCVAANMNQQSIGVAVIGNLELRPATEPQLKALKALLRELVALFQIPVQRVLGHGEVTGAATACPGRYLDLQQLRAIISGVSFCPAPGQGHLVTDASRAKTRRDAPVLWRVQVGAFSNPEAAQLQAQKLRQLGFDVMVVASGAKDK